MMDNALSPPHPDQPFRKLLLIEDDEVDQMAFIRAIRQFPVQFMYEIAGSCREGLEILKNQSFDLILSDINLGDGTVFDIMDDIRKTRIPLVVITGAGDQETAVRALQNGAIDYLIKDVARTYLRMLPVSVERAITRAGEERLLTTLGAAVEQTHAAIAITLPDGVISYCNSGLLEMRKDTDICPTGKPLSYLFQDQEIYTQSLSTADAGGVWSGEVENRDPNGLSIWQLVTLSQIRGKEGEKAGYLWIAEDISILKAAEQALSSEKERLDITLHSIGDGVIAASSEGEILYMNPKAYDLCGKAAKDAQSGLLDEVYLPLDPRTRASVSDTEWKDTSDNRGGERRYLLNGPHPGEFRLIEQHISPLPFPDKTTGIVLVFHDITDMVRKEEESRRLSQLESLGLLAGGIAHDLNNVLTIILSNLVMARDIPSIDEDVKKRLLSAENAVYRAKSLSKQFLTFSPGGEPVVEKLQLDSFLRNAPGGYIKGGDIQIIYNIPPDIPPVLADPGQLGVAIHQIARNAVESMEDSGKLCIRCRTVNKADDLQVVVIEIEDTGSGIPPEILPRIFEPYFSTKKEMKGLGLTTAHSIITRHKGTIDIRSTPGRGTCVSISLPVVSDSVNEPEMDKNQVQNKGNRVLIMDDEEMILEILTIMLKRLGYIVDVSRDGEEAMDRYKAASRDGFQYALVIMDLIIPGGVGGKEAIRMLREIDSEIPVMVSSGYSNDPVMADYKSFGFTDSLPKPYNLKNLQEKLSLLAPIEK